MAARRMSTGTPMSIVQRPVSRARRAQQADRIIRAGVPHASPVTVIQIDGTQKVQPAYTRQEATHVIKRRRPKR